MKWLRIISREWLFVFFKNSFSPASQLSGSAELPWLSCWEQDVPVALLCNEIWINIIMSPPKANKHLMKNGTRKKKSPFQRDPPLASPPPTTTHCEAFPSSLASTTGFYYLTLHIQTVINSLLFTSNIHLFVLIKVTETFSYALV